MSKIFQHCSAVFVLVNVTYTSQMRCRNGCLLGKRVGGSFHCLCRVVLLADENVRETFEFERTERQRLELLNQDSSCTPSVSTESEMPISNFA